MSVLLPPVSEEAHLASNTCLRNTLYIRDMFSSIMICSVHYCLCMVFVQVMLLPCLFFNWDWNGLFLPYCLAASKHGHLLATEICGNDHNEKGSVNYQGSPSGKYGSIRTDVPGWILYSGVLHLFIQKYTAWGSFLAKGLTNGYFFTSFTLAMRSRQGSYYANSAPADAILKMKIFSLSGTGIVHQEECILHAQDNMRNFGDCKASLLSYVSHSDVLCSQDLILKHQGNS